MNAEYRSGGELFLCIAEGELFQLHAREQLFLPLARTGLAMQTSQKC
jgi:hypothetical protein